MDVSHNEKFRMSNLYYLKKNKQNDNKKTPVSLISKVII